MNPFVEPSAFTRLAYPDLDDFLFEKGYFSLETPAVESGGGGFSFHHETLQNGPGMLLDRFSSQTVDSGPDSSDFS